VILLLAGTYEARGLAGLLAQRGTLVIASLAGATKTHNALRVPTRIGGFGGIEGLTRFLRAESGMTLRTPSKQRSYYPMERGFS